MKYAGLIKNDFSAAPGVCVTFFVQGCPLRCYNCHNPEAQDFNGGKEFTPQVLDDIVNSLMANGIKRNLCIMGGEPLCDENAFLTYLVIKEVKNKLSDIKVYVWSGYTYEELQEKAHPHIKNILEIADVLIDGPYIDSERDISLNMRGSRNQRIIDLTKKN